MERAGFGADFAEYAAADMARLRRLAGMLADDRETSQDLLQETLVRTRLAWSRIDRNPRGYATTTMARLAWQLHKRRRQEIALLHRHAGRERVDTDFGRVDDALGIAAAMALLGPRPRAVLVLRYYCDLPEQHIADALGCPRHGEEPGGAWVGSVA